MLNSSSISIIGIAGTDTRRGDANQLVGGVVGVIGDVRAVGDLDLVAARIVVVGHRAGAGQLVEGVVGVIRCSAIDRHCLVIACGISAIGQYSIVKVQGRANGLTFAQSIYSQDMLVDNNS